MKNFIGFDIGGTKCSVSLGREENGNLKLLAKKCMLTPQTFPAKTIESLCSLASELLAESAIETGKISAAGVSCGGVIDSERGVIITTPVIE